MSVLIQIVICLGACFLYCHRSMALDSSFENADCSRPQQVSKMVLSIQNQVLCFLAGDQDICQALSAQTPSAKAVLSIAAAGILRSESLNMRAVDLVLSGCKTSKNSFYNYILRPAWARSKCTVGDDLFSLAHQQIQEEEFFLKDMAEKAKKEKDALVKQKKQQTSHLEVKKFKQKIARATADIKLAESRLPWIEQRKKAFNRLAIKAKNIDPTKLGPNLGQDILNSYGKPAPPAISNLKEILKLDAHGLRDYQAVFHPHLKPNDGLTFDLIESFATDGKKRIDANRQRLFRSALGAERLTGGDWGKNIFGASGKAGLKRAAAIGFGMFGLSFEALAYSPKTACQSASELSSSPKEKMFALFARGQNCNDFISLERFDDQGVVELFSSHTLEDITALLLKDEGFDERNLGLCRALVPLANKAMSKGWAGRCTEKGVELIPRNSLQEPKRPYDNRVRINNFPDNSYEVMQSYPYKNSKYSGRSIIAFNSEGEITDIKENSFHPGATKDYSRKTEDRFIDLLRKTGSRESFGKRADYAYRATLSAIQQSKGCCGNTCAQNLKTCSLYGISCSQSKTSNGNKATGTR